MCRLKRRRRIFGHYSGKLHLIVTSYCTPSSNASAHGQLKSVRLPKKFDGSPRGFAFLEFVSRHEAENALAALKHTHLLGRHLVLEMVDDGEHSKEEALERMREKVRISYGDGKNERPGRKRKFEIDTIMGLGDSQTD